MTTETARLAAEKATPAARVSESEIREALVHLVDDLDGGTDLQTSLQQASRLVRRLREQAEEIDAATERLCDLVERLGVSDLDLVREAFSEQAAALNNQGLPDQICWLLEACGDAPAEIERAIRSRESTEEPPGRADGSV